MKEPPGPHAKGRSLYSVYTSRSVQRNPKREAPRRRLCRTLFSFLWALLLLLLLFRKQASKRRLLYFKRDRLLPPTTPSRASFFARRGDFFAGGGGEGISRVLGFLSDEITRGGGREGEGISVVLSFAEERSFFSRLSVP